LVPHTADRSSIDRLLEAAKRNLADADVASISDENRFDAAYKCIMQCATVGLWARGYRTSTSQPGHHQSTIQCLTLTMGVDKETVILIDSLRRQRNINDYIGDPLPEALLHCCIDEARRLLLLVQRRMHNTPHDEE